MSAVPTALNASVAGDDGGLSQSPKQDITSIWAVGSIHHYSLFNFPA